jgi:hypothetical protein
MIVVRVLLQVVIVVMFLLVLSGALLKPLTPTDMVNLLGGALFFALLFVATFSLGEKKEKQWAQVFGYRVNPKTFGMMLVTLGLMLVVGAGLVLSGQPVRESEVWVRGGGILEILFQVPLLLVPAGVAVAWYGVKLIRSQQPNSRMHRTHARTARADDAER